MEREVLSMFTDKWCRIWTKGGKSFEAKVMDVAKHSTIFHAKGTVSAVENEEIKRIWELPAHVALQLEKQEEVVPKKIGR